MNFEFSEEQNMLRDQASGFLRDHCDWSVVRAVLDGDEAYDRELWRKVCELGWTATVIPEEYSGLGLGYLELSVIAEELGRSFAPIPFTSSVYFATEALLLAGTEQQKTGWLPRLAEGSAIGCFAIAEKAGQPNLDKLESKFDGGKLTGTKLAVTDGEIADFAIVVAASAKGAGLYLVELNQSGIQRERLKTLDSTRPQAKITFQQADATPLESDEAASTILEKLYNRAAVLMAWEQVGGATAALEMAKDYALERYAFGRPIGSFQAIKHKLANIYVKNTLARSNCYYAAWALSTNADELPVAAAAARLAAVQAFYFAAKENIQTHGGMGFTWEFNCHIPYRRAKLLSTTLGGELVWQRKLIAALRSQNQAA